jgi:hypothetical protein
MARKRERGVRFVCQCMVAMPAMVGTQVYAAENVSASATVAVSDPRDFSGVWMNRNAPAERLLEQQKEAASGKPAVRRTNQSVRAPPPPPPLTPAYMKLYEKIRAAARGESPDASLGRLSPTSAADCYWQGMVTNMGYPFPMEYLQTPGRITILFEAESQVRRIWMDGRKQPGGGDLQYTYNGNSIGHWEGNTLVVDTVGLRADTLFFGMPHSDETRIVEHIKKIDANTLQDEMTITDPKALSKPVSRTLTYDHKPDWQIGEYSCMDNNRNQTGPDGRETGGAVDNGTYIDPTVTPGLSK